MYVFIFFTAGRGKVGRWVRFWTRSRFGHVSIGVGNRVLEPTMEGDIVLPLVGFMATAPKLRCCLFVPVDMMPDLWPDDADRPRWRSIIRWLSRGRWPVTTDCIATARRILAACGHDTPSSITTPERLHRWLTAKGFHCEAFERVSPRVVARAHENAGGTGPARDGGIGVESGIGEGSVRLGVQGGPSIDRAGHQSVT